VAAPNLFKERVMRFEDKYQPKVFQDLIFEENQVKQKLRLYAEGMRNKHLLLYGPPGTAKTTASVVIANERLPCGIGFVDVLEASLISSNFESELERIEKGWALLKFACGIEHPVAVINEVDQLNVAQQQMLRAFIDRCRLGFLYMTTNNQSSVDQPLRDRCECIEVKSLSSSSVAQRASDIIQAELGFTNEKHVERLMNSTNGSWRDVLLAVEDYVSSNKLKLAT